MQNLATSSGWSGIILGTVAITSESVGHTIDHWFGVMAGVSAILLASTSLLLNLRRRKIQDLTIQKLVLERDALQRKEDEEASSLDVSGLQKKETKT